MQCIVGDPFLLDPSCQPGEQKMIRRNMNKTPSKADIGLDYGLKFFTQLTSGETK